MATILTFNVGLLEVKVPGLRPVMFVPHVPQRRASLPGLLHSIDADVICLQEVFSNVDKESLVGALAERYPFVAGLSEDAGILGSGLLTLCRYPVQNPRFSRYRNQTVLERLFSPRGLLSCQIDLPDLGPCQLINIHTTAGGLTRHPEAPRTESLRRRQLEQTIRVAGENSDRISLIAGDLNAGPEASAVNYEQLARAGYIDCFAQRPGQDRGEMTITWDPENALNDKGPFVSSPPQRVDHVFVRKADVGVQVLVRRACMEMTEPVVSVPGGRTVTPSDHYALVVELDVDPADSSRRA